jgi:hypothetical protein
MTFRRKAALGLALALVAATAAILATGALGSRSAATPPDLAGESPKATVPFAKTPKCKLTACAWVNRDGTLIWGKNVVGSTRVNNPGVYCVRLKDSIKAENVANVLLTIDYFNTATATNISAQWYSADPGFFWCFGNEIAVKTYGNEGGTSALVNAAFTIGIS